MAENSSQGGRMDDAGLEPWRRRFDGADIFTVITHAILVAATDSPQEFQRRRDSIVEQIYNAAADVPVLGTAAAGEGPNSTARRVSAENADNHNQHVHGHGNSSADALDSDLYKLADDMKEASLEKEEVLRIKDILLNHHEQSADYLFESLRRLQLMHLSADVLENTKIELAVAALAKHKSHEIRELVLDITNGWKVRAEEWIASTKNAMASDSDKSLHRANSSANEEEWGLAIPPMDVGALYLSQPDIPQYGSEFFEGIDDDGGIMNNHITSMNKDPRMPLDTAASTKERIMVQDSAAAQLSPLKKTKPKKCSWVQQQGLEKREGQSLQKNPQKMLKGDDETNMSVPLATNPQNPQQQERRSFRIIIKNKPTISKGETRSLSKDTPKVTPREDVKPRQDPRAVTRNPPTAAKDTPKVTPREDVKPRQDPRAVTRNPPTAAATKQPLPGHVIKKGTTAQPLEDPKVELGKRKMPLADDKELEKTRRRLREAYQEAKDEKKKRTIQVMKPHDAPKLDKSPVRKPRRSVRRG